MNDGIVFISYAREDIDVVESLALRLSEAGLTPWHDRELLSGPLWSEQIERKICESKAMLVLLTPNAMRSPFVKREIHYAMDIAHVPVIVPVLRENCVLPLTLAGQQYLDAREPIAIDERLAKEILRAIEGETRTPKQASRTELAGPPMKAITLPRFHYGGVVPPDYFIGRQQELADAEALVTDGHAFLLVGLRRAGKTSFCRKLLHEVMQRAKNDILIGILNLESCTPLTVDTFLGHTILNMIGEIARQVFRCRYTDLMCHDISQLRDDLRHDPSFAAFSRINQQVLNETRYRENHAPSPFASDQFIAFTTDLLDIIRSKGWRQFLMIFDEANHLPTALSVELLEENAHAMNCAQLNCMYAASPQMADSFRRLSEYIGHQIQIGPFSSRQDMLQLLARYYHNSELDMEDLPITAEALDRVWELTEGRPFQLQCMLGYSFKTAVRMNDSLVRETYVMEAHKRLAEERPEYFAHLT